MRFRRIGVAAIIPLHSNVERDSGGPMDVTSEAKKIAFERIGNGETVLFISGFPQTFAESSVC
jgi:hypothetical protein